MPKCAIFVKQHFKKNMLKKKNILKLGTIVIIQVLHVAYVTSSNGSNHGYKFIIKQLAEECE